MAAVTVVIPVYNVAGYLRAGLDSLLAQTVRDWEAVCVDDGSTDGSGAILDEYAARDARISVVRKSNGGLSSSRNAGLDASKGEIILFMDPDDLVLPDWIERMMAGIVGVDLAWGGFVADRGGLVSEHRWADVGTVYEADAVRRRVWRAVLGYRLRDLFRAFSRRGLWRVCGREFAGVWCRAIRRSVLGDLRFDESVRLFEDAIFLSEYALRAKSMRVIGDTGYRYFIRTGGMMTVEAHDHMVRHRFELRDARRRVDPAMSAWRGTFLLSAIDVLRRSGLALAGRYVNFRPYG